MKTLVKKPFIKITAAITILTAAGANYILASGATLPELRVISDVQAYMPVCISASNSICEWVDENGKAHYVTNAEISY